MRRRRTEGFSLVELTMASALFVVVMSVIFQALHPAHGAFQTEPERADLQQRLRVATAVLAEALAGTGAGVSYGSAAGPLIGHLAPVLPLRLGRRSADAPGTYRSDAITLLQTTRGAAQTTLAQPLPARSGVATIALEPGCSSANMSCGFAAGMQAIVLGAGGRFDLFSVTGASGTALTLTHDTRDTAHVYPPGSLIVQATSRVFYLKSDPAGDLFQLMRYDGDGSADAPVVDHVVSLAFRYRGDPEAPRPLNASSVKGPWTTYGPRPPDPSAPGSGYPAGENCAFVVDAASVPAPRLAALGAGGLVELAASQLTDGPWCPDDTDPNRYDADLLRVRAVVVTLRVEAAAASLRGRGAFFLRPGTAAGSRYVPDEEVTIEIAPENLRPGAHD